MSPPPPAALRPCTPRQPRANDAPVGAHLDGLREIELQVIDVKTCGADMADGVGLSGTPTYELCWRQGGRCQPLRSEGEIVRLHDPGWQRQPDAKNSEHNSTADAALGLR